MQKETRASLIQRAGLPANEADCIGLIFGFTYMIEGKETRLVGKIDGLEIEVGTTPVPLSIISSGLTREYKILSLIFWEAKEVFQKGMQPAHWLIVIRNKSIGGSSRVEPEYIEGVLEILS
jgi:hypothetical protein